MDTDVELVASIDDFLKHEAFSGFESTVSIPTGIMASKKGFSLFNEFLNYYDGRHFIKDDGSYDMTTNVKIITDICKKHGFIDNNKLQDVEGFVLYPSDVFCPKDASTGVVHRTENTVAIHHFAGSWLDDGKIKLKTLRQELCRKYGERVGDFLYKTVYVPYRFYVHAKMNGIKRTMKEITNE